MQSRLGQLEAELTRHLAPILRDVPAPVFEELVALIASLQYERESRRFADRPDAPPGADADTPAADDAAP